MIRDMLLLWLGGILIGLSIGSYVQKTSIQASAIDNGCNTHQQIESKQTANQTNYNFDNT